MDIGSFYTTEDDVATYAKMHRMAKLIDGLATEREQQKSRIAALEAQVEALEVGSPPEPNPKEKKK